MIVNIPRINNRMPVALERAWLPFLLLSLAAVAYSPVALDGFRKSYLRILHVDVRPSLCHGQEERDTLYLTKVVVLSSVGPVLYGLFQLGSGKHWYQGTRIESTFTHPNIFAFYLLTTIGLTLSLLSASSVALTRRVRGLLTFYLVPLLAMLVATKTRSAWLGCMIVFVVCGLIADKRILALTLILPVFALAIPSVRDRLTDLAAGNAYVGWVQNVNAYAWRRYSGERRSHSSCKSRCSATACILFLIILRLSFRWRPSVAWTPTMSISSCFLKPGWRVWRLISGYSGGSLSGCSDAGASTGAG